MTDNGWTRVPHKLLLSKLPALDIRVHAYLLWRKGDNENCWPRIATIAEDLGVSRASAGRSIQRLEEAGWVERVPRVGQSSLYNPLLESLVSQLPGDATTRITGDTHEVLEPITRNHVPPPEAKKTPRRRKGDPRVKDMQQALAEVCQIDLNISRNWGWLGKEATALLEAGYTCENVRHFLTWWLADDWRATHTPVPSVRVLRERIGQATNGVDSPAGPTDGTVVIDLGCNDESLW